MTGSLIFLRVGTRDDNQHCAEFLTSNNLDGPRIALAAGEMSADVMIGGCVLDDEERRRALRALGFPVPPRPRPNRKPRPPEDPFL